MKTEYLTPEFVSEIPSKFRPGKVYISIKYRAAVHLCPCGCGAEISTPLSKKYGWVMTYDGELLSLSPSVGNYAYPCKSHYFIKENRVVWVPEEKIEHSVQKKKRSFFKWLKTFRQDK